MIHKRVFLVHALEDNNVSKTVPWEWRLLNTPASRLRADGQKTKIFAYDDHIIPLALRIVWKGCYRISIVLAFSFGRACVAGVKRGRGNLGARVRVGRGPRVWSRALILFPLPFERLPRRLHVDGRKRFNYAKYGRSFCFRFENEEKISGYLIRIRLGRISKHCMLWGAAFSRISHQWLHEFKSLYFFNPGLKLVCFFTELWEPSMKMTIIVI